MPIFCYKAMDSSGRFVSGEIDAADSREVGSGSRDSIRAAGYTVATAAGEPVLRFSLSVVRSASATNSVPARARAGVACWQHAR